MSLGDEPGNVGVLAISSVIFVVVLALLLRALVRGRRGTGGGPSERTFIIGGGIVLPVIVIVIAVLAVLTVRAGDMKYRPAGQEFRDRPPSSGRGATLRRNW